MRLFVGIPVQDAVKDQAFRIKQELNASHADVKWVEKQNYHITLKFLGEVEDNMLPQIQQALQSAAESSPIFRVSAGGIGFFPGKQRPRVIWLGIGGETVKAVFLAQSVDNHLCQLGFKKEKQHKFHLTLGRVRSDRGVNDLINGLEMIKGKDDLTPFKVDRFNLMMSELNRQGPSYTILQEFMLGEIDKN